VDLRLADGKALTQMRCGFHTGKVRSWNCSCSPGLNIADLVAWRDFENLIARCSC
jgi:hypothetical protein